MIKSLLLPNCSIISMSFMDSVVILQRSLTNENINVIRLCYSRRCLLCSSIVMCKILMIVITFFEYMC